MMHSGTDGSRDLLSEERPSTEQNRRGLIYLLTYTSLYENIKQTLSRYRWDLLAIRV